MGMFIEVSFVDERFTKTPEARQLVQVCPVDIFKVVRGEVTVDAEQEDECILCDRCLEIAPGKLRIRKCYDQTDHGESQT